MIACYQHSWSCFEKTVVSQAWIILHAYIILSAGYLGIYYEDREMFKYLLTSQSYTVFFTRCLKVFGRETLFSAVLDVWCGLGFMSQKDVPYGALEGGRSRSSGSVMNSLVVETSTERSAEAMAGTWSGYVEEFVLIVGITIQPSCTMDSLSVLHLTLNNSGAIILHGRDVERLERI